MNANKVNQKSFFKIMILIFGLVCFFNVLTSGEKLPERFNIFRVAVIGSDINGNNKIEDEKYGEESSLKKFTVGRLCSHEMVKKLSEYEGVTVQNGEIFYKNKSLEIPKDSIYLDDTVLSFYYVNNCEDANRILPKCQYAICPFIAKLDEITGDLNADLNECKLKERMIRLKSFVKHYNGMCDTRFLYYTDEHEKSDSFDGYSYIIGQLCINLYTEGLQQDISSKSISKTSEREDYKVFLKHIVLECSAQRAKEFKNWTLNANRSESVEREAKRICKEKNKNEYIDKNVESVQDIYNEFAGSEEVKELIQYLLNAGISLECIQKIFASAKYEENGNIEVKSIWKRWHWYYWFGQHNDDINDDLMCDILRNIFNDQAVHRSLLKLIRKGGKEALTKLQTKIYEENVKCVNKNNFYPVFSWQ